MSHVNRLLTALLTTAAIAAWSCDPASEETGAVRSSQRLGGTGCTASEALDTLQALGSQNALDRAAKDALTATITNDLAPLIVDLRAERAEFVDRDVPSCGEGIKRDLLSAHDEMIIGLTGLSENAPSDEVAAHLELASEHMNRAARSIQTINP